MLSKISITSSQGDTLTLPLDDISSGFIVEKIEGLDPVKATLVSSGFAGMDGEQFQSARRESRNITITLQLDPADWGTTSVSDLRNQLYKYFMPKSEVALAFFLDAGLEVYISGVVETFESTLFTQDPSVDISIVCYNPDFYDPFGTDISQTTVQTDDWQTPIYYSGTVPTGVILSMYINRTIAEFSIYQQMPSGQLRQMDIGLPFQAGDVLYINSVPGDKYVMLSRGGTETSILYAVSPQSSWLEFQPGDNRIKIFDSGAPIPYNIQYQTLYGGL